MESLISRIYRRLHCRIQTRGYVNVDALDEDKNVIDKLRALRLYRNYVTKVEILTLFSLGGALA